VQHSTPAKRIFFFRGNEANRELCALGAFIAYAIPGNAICLFATAPVLAVASQF